MCQTDEETDPRRTPQIQTTNEHGELTFGLGAVEFQSLGGVASWTGAGAWSPSAGVRARWWLFWGRPLFCRVFGGLPLDGRSPLHPIMTTKNVSRPGQMSPGGQKLPHLRTTGLGVNPHSTTDGSHDWTGVNLSVPLCPHL